MFLKEVSYAHQGYIYLIRSEVIKLILWNIIMQIGAQQTFTDFFINAENSAA